MYEESHHTPNQQNYAQPPEQRAGPVFSETLERIKSSEFDLFSILRVLRRQRWVIIGSIALGMACVGVYLSFAKSVYTAQTTLMVDARAKKIVRSEEVLASLRPSDAAINSEIAVIQSPGVLSAVIRKLKLHEDPEYSNKLAEPSVWAKILKAIGLSNNAKAARADDLAGDKAAAGPQDSDQTTLSIVRALKKNLQVYPEAYSYLVNIKFTANDPEKAARIANQIAETYLVEQLEARFRATKRATLWLNERLVQLRQRVTQSEQRVGEYKAKFNLLDTGGETFGERELTKLNEQLVLAKANKAEAEVKYKRLKEVLSKAGKISGVAAFVQSEIIVRLRTLLADTAKREAELTARFRARHPQVLAVRAERRDLRTQINREARRIYENARNTYEVSKSRVESLESSLKHLTQRTYNSRAAAIKLRELQQEAQANREIYAAFLTRFKEASEQQTLQNSDFRVIAPASPPEFASAPKKKKIALVGVALFAVFGVGLAFLNELLDKSFKTSRQVEDVLRVPHLASVPMLTKQDRTHEGRWLPEEEVVIAKPFSDFAQALSNVRIGVRRLSGGEDPRVILMTSAIPDEGKTMLSACLARQIALREKKTLVIDADLRYGALSDRIAKKSAEGLSTILEGRSKWQDAIQIDKLSGLHILPAALRKCDAAELLSSAEMKELLRDVRHHYDVIVIDSAPVVPVIDTHALIEMVDVAILTIAWGETAQEVSEEAVKYFRRIRPGITGAILNKIDYKTLAEYDVLQSYYGYGYKGDDKAAKA